MTETIVNIAGRAVGRGKGYSLVALAEFLEERS